MLLSLYLLAYFKFIPSLMWKTIFIKIEVKWELIEYWPKFLCFGYWRKLTDIGRKCLRFPRHSLSDPRSFNFFCRPAHVSISENSQVFGKEAIGKQHLQHILFLRVGQQLVVDVAAPSPSPSFIWLSDPGTFLVHPVMRQIFAIKRSGAEM